VCERVGKTLVSTATLRPARASCSEARMPEPPPPTITASNVRVGMLLALMLLAMNQFPHRIWMPQTT
jgi:hypothetical protein